MAKLFPDTASGGRWPEKKVLQTVSNSNTTLANEVKTELITATGGTRTLTFNGQTTSALAFDADSLTIRTALIALSNLGVGDIEVTGGSGNFNYIFSGAFAKTAVSLTVNPALLTGGTSNIYTNVAPGVLDSAVSTILQTNLKREATQEALAAKGLLRSPSQAQNDLEAFNADKPKDIGDPARYNPDGSPKYR